MTGIDGKLAIQRLPYFVDPEELRIIREVRLSLDESPCGDLGGMLAVGGINHLQLIYAVP